MKRSSSCCLLLRLRNTKPDGPKIMVTTSHRPHICWPHATINAPSMHRKRNPLTGPALFPKKFTWPPKMPNISLSPHVFSLKNSMKFFEKIHKNCSPLPLMVDHDFRILELISRFIFIFFLDFFQIFLEVDVLWSNRCGNLDQLRIRFHGLLRHSIIKSVVLLECYNFIKPSQQKTCKHNLGLDNRCSSSQLFRSGSRCLSEFVAQNIEGP